MHPTTTSWSAETGEQLATLRRDLEQVWSADTTAHDTFDPARPSAGQCAPTALIVQDRFGGTLRRALVAGESHYWNLIDGHEVDLTRDQFPVWVCDGDIIDRDRDYVVGFAPTAERYQRLTAALESLEAAAQH